jgi:hypothetical protein
VRIPVLLLLLPYLCLLCRQWTSHGYLRGHAFSKPRSRIALPRSNGLWVETVGCDLAIFPGDGCLVPLPLDSHRHCPRGYLSSRTFFIHARLGNDPAGDRVAAPAGYHSACYWHPDHARIPQPQRPVDLYATGHVEVLAVSCLASVCHFGLGLDTWVHRDALLAPSQAWIYSMESSAIGMRYHSADSWFARFY